MKDHVFWGSTSTNYMTRRTLLGIPVRILLLLATLGVASCTSTVAENAQEHIESLIEHLDSADFNTQSAAITELQRLGTAAEPSLRAHLRHERAEVASRCAALLEEVETRKLEAIAQIRAKVIFVDGANGIVVISAGSAEGVTLGMQFDICRGTRLLACAEVEAFLGPGRNSRIRILRGQGRIQLDDAALHF